MKILLLSAAWCGLVTCCWLFALATIFTTPALWLLSFLLRRLRPWVNL
jgi:energy-converting hydrogenase Eha subunit G